MKDLFKKETGIKARAFQKRPLAYRMRPDTLEEFVGQDHLLSPGRQLRTMIETGKIFSVIFYGPPGCGKTALAGVISSKLQIPVEKINAVSSGVKEIRNITAKASRHLLSSGTKTLLVIDEFHRFSKIQQEALLPDVEEGNIVLAGITTENPYYFIVGPLLSRTRVFEFKALNKQQVIDILKNALENPHKGLGDKDIQLSPEAAQLIARKAGGDARYALNILEITAEALQQGKIDSKTVQSLSADKKITYDRASDQHYNTISAFIKSMRGSDPDAAVYYLAKMVLAGEDPRFIARRIIICASEDVGNADPRALIVSGTALNAVEKVGFPEAKIILAQAAIYIATAPKSNASCVAINRAENNLEESSSFSLPEHLTKKGSDSYRYPHDYKYGYCKQKYMEQPVNFYQPMNRGHEKYIKKYLKFIGNIPNEK